mgnify:CR=1 FL=1
MSEKDIGRMREVLENVMLSSTMFADKDNLFIKSGVVCN